MTTRPKTFLGWLVGSDDEAYRLLERLGLVPFLTRIVNLLARAIAKVQR